MFSVAEPKIIAGNYPDDNDVVFQTTLSNYENRMAEVSGYYFELWVWRDRATGGGVFISSLSPDLRYPEQSPCQFKSQDVRPLRLLWHSTPEQVQVIEDHRRGGGALLQIRAQLNVTSWYPNGQGGYHPPRRGWEGILCGSTQHVLFAVPPSEWVAVLEKLGFRHIHLRELPTHLPEELKVPEAHLTRAWAEHRTGRPEPALSQCFMAVECLAFNLYNDETLSRDELARRILDGLPERKWKEFKSLLCALTDFLHLGRHERGAPVPLDYSDSELAVIVTSMVLEYVASQIKSRREP